MKGLIYFMERNIHGAWVVYGAIGIKQYYYYTKTEARQQYLQACKGKVFYND